MPRHTKADVGRILATINEAGIRLGMRGAGTWTVRTLGGTYLYLTQADGQRIENLGASWHSAGNALIDFSRALHTVELLQKEGRTTAESAVPLAKAVQDRPEQRWP